MAKKDHWEQLDQAAHAGDSPTSRVPRRFRLRPRLKHAPHHDLVAVVFGPGAMRRPRSATLAMVGMSVVTLYVASGSVFEAWQAYSGTSSRPLMNTIALAACYAIIAFFSALGAWGAGAGDASGWGCALFVVGCGLLSSVFRLLRMLIFGSNPAPILASVLQPEVIYAVRIAVASLILILLYQPGTRSYCARFEPEEMKAIEKKFLALSGTGIVVSVILLFA